MNESGTYIEAPDWSSLKAEIFLVAAIVIIRIWLVAVGAWCWLLVSDQYSSYSYSYSYSMKKRRRRRTEPTWEPGETPGHATL
jgi:hypothetical protein